MGGAVTAREASLGRRKYVPVGPPQEIEPASTGTQDPTRKMLDFPGAPGCGRS